MKKIVYGAIILVISLGISGCATSNGYGFGVQNNFRQNDLTPIVKKIHFNQKYKSLPAEKAFAYAKSRTTGYYVFGMCSNGSDIKNIQECAISNCQKKIENFMKIKNNQCKIYANNNKIVWK